MEDKVNQETREDKEPSATPETGPEEPLNTIDDRDIIEGELEGETLDEQQLEEPGESAPEPAEEEGERPLEDVPEGDDEKVQNEDSKELVETLEEKDTLEEPGAEPVAGETVGATAAVTSGSGEEAPGSPEDEEAPSKPVEVETLAEENTKDYEKNQLDDKVNAEVTTKDVEESEVDSSAEEGTDEPEPADVTVQDQSQEVAPKTADSREPKHAVLADDTLAQSGEKQTMMTPDTGHTEQPQEDDESKARKEVIASESENLLEDDQVDKGMEPVALFQQLRPPESAPIYPTEIVSDVISTSTSKKTKKKKRKIKKRDVESQSEPKEDYSLLVVIFVILLLMVIILGAIVVWRVNGRRKPKWDNIADIQKTASNPTSSTFSIQLPEVTPPFLQRIFNHIRGSTAAKVLLAVLLIAVAFVIGFVVIYFVTKPARLNAMTDILPK